MYTASINTLVDSIRTSNLEPLAMFLIVAISGLLSGKLFSRIRLPDITGQIAAGIILGMIFSQEALHSISDFRDIALGIMTFTVGTHLSMKVLHNSRTRIFNLSLFDVFFTAGLVFACLLIFVSSLSWIECMLLASIAIVTAPSTLISLIQKKYARGVLAKTLVGTVALNNFATILVFVICKSIVIDTAGISDSEISFYSVLALPLTIITGTATGLVAACITKHQHMRGSLFATVFITILFNVLLCRLFKRHLHVDMSHLLVNLTMGVTYTNTSYHAKTIIDDVFGGINTLLFAVFFTLAGTHLNPAIITVAGFAGMVFVVARIIAKCTSAYLACKIFKYPAVIAKFLGPALIPQAGLAVGLVISLGGYPEFNELVPMVSTIVLAAVLVNEFIGPMTASWAIEKAGESGQATPRLVDFLHEEYILTPLKADNKWQAIEKMCDFLVKTNHLHSISREEMLARTVTREKECTTGIGNRLAVPHARIPSKEKLMGVIGICPDPIDFNSVDGEPVNIVILVATPEGHEDIHVKLMGVVARIFADDPPFQRRLVEANGPAQVYDLLQSKQIRDINSFLEEV